MKYRHWKIFLGVVFLSVIVVTGIGLNFLFSSFVKESAGIRYVVRPGATLHSVINDLHQKGILHHPLLFKLLTRLRLPSHPLKIRAGEYLFPKGTTPSSLLEQLTTGSGMIYYSFTIVPGWSFQQVKEALAKENEMQHRILSLTDNEIMTQIGLPNGMPEGQFFPDTYFFLRGSADLSLLKRAYKLMQSKLLTGWSKREVNLPFKTPYEALIAASLIEKEAYFNHERPLISSVLVNRLKKDMLLQFDPTVIYGLGAEYDGTIHKNDLVKNTPYNTYLRKGLPPTPIAMPSLNSLDAALHPLQTDYLYFVARGDRSHQFSKTLEEHNVAVSVSKNVIRSSFFNVELMERYLQNTCHASMLLAGIQPVQELDAS